MNRARRVALLVTALGGGAASIPTGTLTLQPDSTTGQDAYVYQDDLDTNFGNGTSVIVDLGGAVTERRGLIKFDLSSLADKTIQSAALTFWSAAGMPNPGTFKVHRVLAAAAWTETGVTWNARNGTDPWPGAAGCSVAGTDYATAVMGTLNTTGQIAGTPLPITLDVAEFTTLAGANHGLLLIAEQTNAVGFRSCENATSLQRPKLVVVYSPP